MTPTEFEARLRDLLKNHATVTQNAGCIECERCQKCVLSTFCRDSSGLVRSHYCIECVDCTDCSHCQASRGLLACSHCVASERCTGGAYLVRCAALSSCSYCFGCVGLQNKDFHILNEPYDRSTYFALTRKLRRELAPPGVPQRFGF